MAAATATTSFPASIGPVVPNRSRIYARVSETDLERYVPMENVYDRTDISERFDWYDLELICKYCYLPAEDCSCYWMCGFCYRSFRTVDYMPFGYDETFTRNACFACGSIGFSLYPNGAVQNIIYYYDKRNFIFQALVNDFMVERENTIIRAEFE